MSSWCPPRVSKDYTRFNSSSAPTTLKALRLGKWPQQEGVGTAAGGGRLPILEDSEFKPSQRAIITAYGQSGGGGTKPEGQLAVTYCWNDPEAPTSLYMSIKGSMPPTRFPSPASSLTGVQKNSSATTAEEGPGTFNLYVDPTWAGTTKDPNGLYVWGATGDDDSFDTQTDCTPVTAWLQADVVTVAPTETMFYRGDANIGARGRCIWQATFMPRTTGVYNLGKRTGNEWGVLHTVTTDVLGAYLVQRGSLSPLTLPVDTLPNILRKVPVTTALRMDTAALETTVTVDMPSAFSNGVVSAARVDTAGVAGIILSMQRHIGARLAAMEAVF